MTEIWKPNVTVAALVEHQGRLLFVEEETDEGLRFNQPAGHLEAGETLVDAMVRETLEESGCVVAPLGLVGVYRWHNAEKDRVYLRFAFAARLIEQLADQPLDAGIVRAVWMDARERKAASPKWRSPLL
jgi:ADP-ribose pyrophosphatase YjhB (NUDIX family)